MACCSLEKGIQEESQKLKSQSKLYNTNEFSAVVKV